VIEPEDADTGTISPAIVGADVAWIIVASCLVLFMTPGLAFFYAGMVRRKNVISTLMQSYICLGVITILWTIYGFSLSFGEDRGGVIGSPHTHFFYKKVGAAPDSLLGTTIPYVLFSIFQLYFAVITPALISGE
jgi:Amt family ammonium transporter